MRERALEVLLLFRRRYCWLASSFDTSGQLDGYARRWTIDRYTERPPICAPYVLHIVALSHIIKGSPKDLLER